MMEREITYTVRASHLNCGPDRFITHIGGAWGLAAEEDAIRDIRYGFHQYFVRCGGECVEVRIARGVIRNYLTTSTEEATPTLLMSLPHPFSPVKALDGSAPASLRLAEDRLSAA